MEKPPSSKYSDNYRTYKLKYEPAELYMKKAKKKIQADSDQIEGYSLVIYNHVIYHKHGTLKSGNLRQRMKH